MKNISLYIISALLLLVSCNQNSNESVGSDGMSNESVNGQGGSLATFALKGNYLYAVDNQKLTVFSIEDTKNPVKVNSLEVGFNIETLFSYKDYMFIGSQNAMYIYDVTEPELPKKLSQSDHFRSCDPVVANDEYAYVTLHAGSNCGGSKNVLKTYSIKDIKKPVLLNERGLTAPKGLSLYGNYLLVCDGKVKIFDVTDPENSKFLKEIPSVNSIDIIIREDHAFIICEKYIEQYELDKNDIKNFTKISSFNF